MAYQFLLSWLLRYTSVYLVESLGIFSTFLVRLIAASMSIQPCWSASP